MKGLAFGVLAILVLLAAAVVIVPSFVDWNTYKPELVAAVRNVTGRDIAVDGNIRFKVLPTPALSVADVRVAGRPGAPAPHLATLRSLDVRVALVPLLTGEVRVESIRLVEPTITLERLPDGGGSWEAGPDGAGGRPGDGDGPALRLERIEIENGTLIYRDAGAGTEHRLQALSLVGSATSLNGPFEATGQARLRDMPVSFIARAGRFGQGRAVPVLLNLGLPGDGSLTLAGELAEKDGEAAFAGTLKAASADPAALLRRGAGFAPQVPRPLAGRLELDGQVEASPGHFAANGLNLRLGDMQATGAVSAALRDRPRIDATLAVNRLDLDALLPAVAGGSGEPTPGEPPPEGAGSAYPTLPADLTASLSLTVDGIAYREGVLRQARLTASLDDGVLTIAQAGALLPGGSDLKLAGVLTTADVLPRFEGHVEMTSDNLRGLLGWLQVDVGWVPAGRFGNMGLTGALRATPELVELYGMNLRLDASTVTGGLAFLTQARPSFGIDLEIDRVNLDGYLPEAAPRREAGAGADGAGAGAADGGLAALDGFDTNFRLRVGRLTYNHTPVDDVDLDLSLVAGTLELRKATVGNLAGASASLAATGTGLGGAAPSFEARLRLLANDITGLTRLAGLQLPVRPASLGKAELSAAVQGTAARLALDAQATLGRFATSAKGTVAAPLTAPRVEATLRLDHPSLAQLSQLLDLGLAPLPGADGPVALTAAVKGGAQEISVDGEVKAAGATLGTAGRFSDLAAVPKLDVAVNLVHGDLRGFLRGLGVDYDPARRGLGGLGLSARIQGDTGAMTVSDLKGVLGPVQLAGTGAIRLDGPRPYVQADLQTGELAAEMFLAPAAPGGGAAAGGARQAASPAGRWSRETIDISGLGALDADLRLAAAALRFDAYRLVEPELTLGLKEGVLRLAPLTGRLFDGQVRLEGTVESRPRPAVALRFDLQDADLRQTLAAAGLDKVDGVVSLQGELASAGASQWALVSGLNGTVQVSGGNGAVQGFDMRLLSDRLGRLNKIPDFLDLAARAFSGGQTGLRTIEGTWTITDGIARSDDTRADLDAAAAELSGSVNLPAWEMDVTTVLRLTEHPEAPPVAVVLDGPVDEPRREVRTRELEQFVARRVGETVIRKSLENEGKALDKLLDQTLGGGGSDGRPPAGDAVRGVLQDLLKKN